MTSETQELHAIQERIRKLEVQNQRLRRGLIAIMALVSFVILLGQAAPSPRVLEAQRFVLKDSEGNVRGWMGTIGKGTELTLGNVDAQPMMRLIVSTDSSDLHFFGSGKSGLNLGLDSGNPDISMMGAEASGSARITIAERGPSFTLEDAKGFSTFVGVTHLGKPTDRKDDLTSAASIMLSDKDKKVIWKAP
jgi:hypothetical protein